MIEAWIRVHTHNCGGLGAIYPPMIYTIIGLRARGHSMDHPIIKDQFHQLDRLMIEEGDTIRFQPCFSPVWDTGYAAFALADAGLDHRNGFARKAAEWLVSKECKIYGDWKNNVRDNVEPSGWFFEYENEQYPDVDDTAMVAMALRRIGGAEAIAASKRGVAWMLAMQNDDGGWAAFDRTKDRPILEQIPFADHNAIQDPSCPDITGRTLECLSYHGFTKDHPAVRDAIRFMKSRQERDGCWFGRWGVNYIYGTWQVVGGLRAVGYDMSEAWVQRAGQWLRSVQKPDGSFGETANSYEDPSLRGTGPSTASQTAWGAMAMMSIYGPHDAGVQRAMQWLLDTQLENGNWKEDWFTGTGFPKVFYLRYHYYKLYFPIMALGRWLKGHVQAS
jgi:squalene-hopene/tetraprenyl-beta-curcumene cyclase